jgi:RNA polymerase sigma-70 factor (ECF subfamily)
MRIASNALADRWRRLSREFGTESAEASCPDPNPEELEVRAQLFRLVESLPEDQRRVVQLRFAHEKSVKEIAQALGKTEGAVKQLQFRGLAALRAEVSKQTPRKSGEAHG